MSKKNLLPKTTTKAEKEVAYLREVVQHLQFKLSTANEKINHLQMAINNIGEALIIDTNECCQHNYEDEDDE